MSSKIYFYPWPESKSKFWVHVRITPLMSFCAACSRLSCLCLQRRAQKHCRLPHKPSRSLDVSSIAKRTPWFKNKQTKKTERLKTKFYNCLPSINTDDIAYELHLNCKMAWTSLNCTGRITSCDFPKYMHISFSPFSRPSLGSIINGNTFALCVAALDHHPPTVPYPQPLLCRPLTFWLPGCTSTTPQVSSDSWHRHRTDRVENHCWHVPECLRTLSDCTQSCMGHFLWRPRKVWIN